MFSIKIYNSCKTTFERSFRLSQHVRSLSQGSYLHNPGTVPLSYITIGDAIAHTTGKFPGRTAVRSVHEGLSITYEDLLRKADALGCALRAQGLETGDRLGIWSHNSISWIVTLVAAARVGLISVLLNPMYEIPELSYCIKKTGMKSLFIGEKIDKINYYNMLNKFIPELNHSQPGFLQSKELPTLTSIISPEKEKLAGTLTLNSLITGSDCDVSRYSNDIQPDDGTIIHFTSGTTGNPKAALDSHFNLVNNTYFTGIRNRLHDGHQTICVQVPLFHALGSVVTLLGALRHGATLVLASPTYSVTSNIKALYEEKCSVIIGTPTMFVDILSQVKHNGDIPPNLRVALAAGAPCSPQLIMDMRKYLGAEVKALYGMTEVTASVFQSIDGDSAEQVAETVGYIQDHVELKVVDENNKPVPFGSPGELLVRGYVVMKYYWDEPEKTKETIDENGWLRTGDKLIMNENGYGRIVGRIKDIIVRGGENIAPKEIEDILNTHPDIIESQVVGVSDERLGEELCAVLRVRDGASFNVNDIAQHCAGKLARFKIPRLMRVIEEFPKTTSGKIQKYKLRDMIDSGAL